MLSIPFILCQYTTYFVPTSHPFTPPNNHSFQLYLITLFYLLPQYAHYSLSILINSHHTPLSIYPSNSPWPYSPLLHLIPIILHPIFHSKIPSLTCILIHPDPIHPYYTYPLLHLPNFNRLPSLTCNLIHLPLFISITPNPYYIPSQFQQITISHLHPYPARPYSSLIYLTPITHLPNFNKLPSPNLTFPRLFISPSLITLYIFSLLLANLLYLLPLSTSPICPLL